MIRPITVICWILALGAGLYLYRAKHEVELMDKHIEQIAKQTGELRGESRSLLDDWIRLGEPEQLHKYSDEYLGLKTIAPSQFARLSDLPGRLPSPRADPAPEQPADLPSGQPSGQPTDQPDVVSQTSDGPTSPVASATAAPVAAPGADASMAATDGSDDAEDLPVPPIPPPTIPTLTAVSLPAVTVAPLLQAKPVTPRPPPSASEQEVVRTRALPVRAAEDPQLVASRPSSAAQSDPRRLINGQSGETIARQPDRQPPGTPPGRDGASRAQESPPLQAQAVPPALPPLRPAGFSPLPEQGAGGITRVSERSAPQAQHPSYNQAPSPGAYRPSAPEVGQIPPARAYGQSPPAPANGQAPPAPANGQPAYRAADPRASQPQRPAFAQPAQVQVADPRGQAYPAYRQNSPPSPVTSDQAGSLLGRPRGPVPAPLPLPAPTPVSATWSPSAVQGR